MNYDGGIDHPSVLTCDGKSQAIKSWYNPAETTETAWSLKQSRGWACFKRSRKHLLPIREASPHRSYWFLLWTFTIWSLSAGCPGQATAIQRWKLWKLVMNYSKFGTQMASSDNPKIPQNDGACDWKEKNLPCGPTEHISGQWQQSRPFQPESLSPTSFSGNSHTHKDLMHSMRRASQLLHPEPITHLLHL